MTTVEVLQDKSNLTPRPRRRRQLFGSVSLRQVDDGLHRSGEFVDVTHIGKISLRYAAERLRCDAIEQDDAEIAVFTAGRSTGVEFFPAKMECGVGLLSGHFPMRYDFWVFADHREPLVGMRCQLEEQ